jgi:BirA family biotin operon repressor/biotin-[acetyl-CoA-carboxylase] ligase
MVNDLNLDSIHAALSNLPMGGIRYYEKIGSTNDLANAWAGQNAANMSLVITDEQTSGRGRNGRIWYTPAGLSLAFSLILRPEKEENHSVGLFSCLGALAVVQAIKKLHKNLNPEIKWPNDVLVNKQKICGILTEVSWRGEHIESLIIGIGVNVLQGSVPPLEILNFPANCLESVSYSKINRIELLYEILLAISDLRKQMETVLFMDTLWEHLAFKGEMVHIVSENLQPRSGIITGLDPGGGLCLQDLNGNNFTAHYGEVHLKPFRL